MDKITFVTFLKENFEIDIVIFTPNLYTKSNRTTTYHVGNSEWCLITWKENYYPLPHERVAIDNLIKGMIC